VTLSSKRREALADVALRYSVPIIEDDAYGMLPLEVPDALATFAPDLTYYVTGFSKSFGAGLRVAYICAPSARRAQHLAGALRATTVMASPFTMLLATQWINDGTASAMLDAIRSESNARQAIVARVLDGFTLDADPNGFHFWMPIAPNSGWNASELALQLRSQGIGVVSAAAFATDGNPPEAVRVCLGGPKSLDDCEDALRLIADTVLHPHHLHLPVM
jgi:DNA-binding transcriptional MocR family regulator